MIFMYKSCPEDEDEQRRCKIQSDSRRYRWRQPRRTGRIHPLPIIAAEPAGASSRPDLQVRSTTTSERSRLPAGLWVSSCLVWPIQKMQMKNIPALHHVRANRALQPILEPNSLNVLWTCAGGPQMSQTEGRRMRTCEGKPSMPAVLQLLHPQGRASLVHRVGAVSSSPSIRPLPRTLRCFQMWAALPLDRCRIFC